MSDPHDDEEELQRLADALHDKHSPLEIRLADLLMLLNSVLQIPGYAGSVSADKQHEASAFLGEIVDGYARAHGSSGERVMRAVCALNNAAATAEQLKSLDDINKRTP